MRRLLLPCLLASFALLAAAPPARAATLPFTATLSIQVGSLPGAVFTGSGTAVSNGIGTTFTLPSGLFAGGVTFPASLFTGVPQISGVKVVLTGNGSGSFNPTFVPPSLHTTHVGFAGGGVGGPMQVFGTAGVNVLQLFSLSIPLSKLGLGSSVTAYLGAIAVTAFATQWTTGMAYVRGVPITLVSPHLPTSTTLPGTWTLPSATTTLTGSDARSAGGAGSVTLVSPVKAQTNVAGNFPVFVILSVNFIPEPGTALLLLAGVVGLAAFGRTRGREEPR